MKKLLVLIGVAAAACSRGSSNSTTLSARLGAPNGQSLPSDGGTAQVANGIELTRVRIAVRRLRVERKDSTFEVKLSEGPLLVDVSGEALSGALLQLVTANVPAGTYDKLKLDIHKVESAPAGAFDDLVSRSSSVLLEGTIDGIPFTFASALEAELEHEGRFELGATPTNITLDLDATKWFQGADGSRLDPRDAANRAAIDDNIRASFRAFEDDDEDGADDEAEHADGGHHDGGDDDDPGDDDGKDGG